VSSPETEEEDAITLLAVGPKKAGKSTLAIRWIRDLLTNGRHVALVSTPDPKFIGHRWASLEEFEKSTPWKAINIFPGIEPTELAAFALKVGKRRRVVLVIDELDTAVTPRAYADPPTRRGELKKKGPLRTVLHEGRHNRVDLVGTCRRLSNVHGDLRNLVHAMALFRTGDQEGTLDRLPEDVRAKVDELDPEKFQYVVWYPHLLRPVEIHK